MFTWTLEKHSPLEKHNGNDHSNFNSETVVSFLALIVGGMIGWLARQHSYETTPQIVYTHPEMSDENGQLVPDEIVAVRFENNYDNDEEEDDD